MLQQLLVLAIVTAAVAYTGRRILSAMSAARHRKAGGACGPDCGCGK